MKMFALVSLYCSLLVGCSTSYLVSNESVEYPAVFGLASIELQIFGGLPDGSNGDFELIVWEKGLSAADQERVILETRIKGNMIDHSVEVGWEESDSEERKSFALKVVVRHGGCTLFRQEKVISLDLLENGRIAIDLGSIPGSKSCL